MFVVGTAANSNFFLNLQQMIYSLRGNVPEGTPVVILDNGLKPEQRNLLKIHFGFVRIIIIEKQLTPFQKTSYQFKCLVHDYILNEFPDKIYLWLDTKTNLKYNQIKLVELTNRCLVWGHTPFHQAEHLWTDKRTMDALGLEEYHRQTLQIQASAMLVDLRKQKGKEFLKLLIDTTLIDEIVCPPGSNKGSNPPSHRQDQSIMSCLMKREGYLGTLVSNEPWALCHNTLFH